MAFYGDFTPVLAKHTRGFSLTDALGVDRMQRNFDPLRRRFNRRALFNNLYSITYRDHCTLIA